jgi:3',5'-cyclic-AMP phosphodiesterase
MKRILVVGCVLSFLCVAWTSAIAQDAATNEPSLNLVFYTDVHARPEWNTPKALELAAAAINAQNPDLVIGGGDYITDGFQSAITNVELRWQTYLAMQEAIHAPVQPAMGNHDLVAAIPEDGSAPAEDPRGVYCEKMKLGNTYRSFDTNGYHFILLDSIKVIGGNLKYEGRIEPEQLDWLKADLTKVDSKTPIVLVSHMPFLTTFFQDTEGGLANAPKNRIVVNGPEVLALFRKHNLILVLQGHMHIDEVIRTRGITFVTGGAVCGKWWRGDWNGTKEGFVVVTLRGNSVESKYVEYGWKACRPANE